MIHPFESLWIEFEPVVHKVAHEFGNKGHRYGANADDFRQEAVCWMLENERELSQRREEIGEPDKFEKYLATCLRNEANDYLVDVRDQAGGQPRHGAYWYTVNELKALLPSMFDPEKWHEPPVSDEGGGRSQRRPAEGGNWIATLADVARAYSRLDKADRDLLENLHRYGGRNKDLAEEAGVTEATMSYRHTQCLKRLLRELGGPRPSPMRPDHQYDPWRGRHAVSNAASRARQSSYYESSDQ